MHELVINDLLHTKVYIGMINEPKMIVYEISTCIVLTLIIQKDLKVWFIKTS